MRLPIGREVNRTIDLVLNKQEIVLDEHFDCHLDLLLESFAHCNGCAVLHLLIVFLKFFPFRPALDVKPVEREHTVSDDIG